MNALLHRHPVQPVQQARPNRSLKGDPHRQASVGRDTVHVIIGLAAHTAFPAVAP